MPAIASPVLLVLAGTLLVARRGDARSLPIGASAGGASLLLTVSLAASTPGSG